MTLRRARRFAAPAFVLLPLLVGGTAAGGQEPGPPAVSLRDSASAETRPWLRSRLERVRRERMARFLGLDSALVERVDRDLRAFRQREVELRGERLRILAELRHALADTLVGGRIESLREELLRGNLDALRRNEAERRAALEELRERLGRDLTVEQRAKLRIFAERFHHQLEEHARRIRERRPGQGPEPPGHRHPAPGRGRRP